MAMCSNVHANHLHVPLQIIDSGDSLNKNHSSIPCLHRHTTDLTISFTNFRTFSCFTFLETLTQYFACILVFIFTMIFPSLHRTPTGCASPPLGKLLATLRGFHVGFDSTFPYLQQNPRFQVAITCQIRNSVRSSK